MVGGGGGGGGGVMSSASDEGGGGEQPWQRDGAPEGNDARYRGQRSLTVAADIAEGTY